MALQTKVYTATNNGFTLELTLVENSTSTTANTSSIGYTLKLKSTSKDFAQYGVGATVQLDGKTVATRDRYSAPQISIGTYASVTLLSGTATVGHNADGKKSMSVKFTLDMATASWTPGSMTGTATMTLTNIPRQATITSAPNFTDEDSPVLKYSNPAGGTLQAGIATTSGTFKVAYRTVTGSSYTFNLTSQERDALRGINTTSNTVSVRFYLKTTIGGQTFTTYSTKTLTIKNPAPTLAPAVEDINPTTVALTGDASTLIKGYSNASVTTGAQAVKKATLKSQKVTCGKKTLTGNGTIEAVESGTFAFEATDSRGNTTKQTVTKTIIDYFPPTCAIQPGAPDLLGNFTLKAAGATFAGNFGSVKNVVTAQYRYRTQGSNSWPSWESMSISDEQSYTATASLTGLDTKTPYEFQVRVTDKLTTTESAVKVVRTTPLVILQNGMVDVRGTFAINGVPLPIQDQVEGLGDAVQKAEQAAAAADVAKQAAEEAKEVAAQSVSESQEAKEVAAQSAQVAQEAAARAEEVDAYTKQESNDRFALALKTATGKGTSHEIYPDAGSNIVVTAYGFTEQEGEGGPSPGNVRAIKVGGQTKWIKQVFTPELISKISDYNGISATIYTPDGEKARGPYYKIYSNALENIYYSSTFDSIWQIKFSAQNHPGSFFFVTKYPYDGVESVKSAFLERYNAGDPVTFWYESWVDQDPPSTIEFNGIPVQAGANCIGGVLPLTGPLCDGDYIVSDQDGRCVEVHTRISIVLDGTEDWSTIGPVISLSVPGLKPYDPTLKCSHAISYQGDPGRLTVGSISNLGVSPGGQWGDLFSDVDSWKAYLHQQYEAGTPVTVETGLASTVTYTHAHVPLIAKPDATGKVIVSGEKEVSVIYNKSLKKAFEELQTAILSIGGTTL